MDFFRYEQDGIPLIGATTSRQRIAFRRRVERPEPAASRWTAYGQWPIHYRAAGSGPPVLLLHGLGGSARYWDGLAADLSQTHRVIAPDLLGFGDSAKPSVAYEPDLHRAVVAAVLAHAVGDEPLHAVVGHSFGAVLAILVATGLARPPASLALITPPFPRGGGAFRRETERLSPLNRFLLSCEPVMRATHVGMQAVWPAVCRLRTRRALFSPELLAEYGKYTYHSYTSTLWRGLFEFDLRPALAPVGDLPTLIMQAERDPLVPADHAPAIARRLGNATLERLPSRHHPALSHREMVADRLREWLARHPRQQAAAPGRRYPSCDEVVSSGASGMTTGSPEPATGSRSSGAAS